MTWRMVHSLLAWLPPESATKTALRDDLPASDVAAAGSAEGKRGHGPWSRQHHLLADICDRLDRVAFVVARTQGVKVPPPEPYPRPGVARRGEQTASPAAIAFLENIRRRRAGPA